MNYLHTMLRVTDLPKTITFFCDVLGFIEVSRKDYPQGRFTLVFLAAAGDFELAKINKAPLIELTYNWDESHYDSGRNFGHLAYRVNNIYDVCEKVMQKNIIINRPPRDGYMAFIKTPNGISIELLQKGDALPPKEPWVSMENKGSW